MNEKIEVPTMQVPPLKKICMTIGQLPTSYLETMSYYEMLVWFVNYLRDDIIPVVNANGEATEELQQLFAELQAYVNYKFDNLEIQEEVDNKIEELLENGTLANILLNWTDSFRVYETTTQMIADNENIVAGEKIKTLGYSAINDGGGATFLIGNTLSNDYLQINIENGLYANLIIEKDTINVKQLGIVGDNTTDYSTIINKIFGIKGDKYLKIEFNENETYLMQQQLYLYSNTDIYLNGGTLKSCYDGNATSEYVVYGNGLRFMNNADSIKKSGGYGALENVHVKNGTIDGDTTGASFFLFHALNCTFENILFKNCCTGTHVFDMGGCKEILIKDCNFDGYMIAVSDNYYREVIQFDYASRLNVPYWGDDPDYKYDDLNCDTIIVENCTFSKGEGTYYPSAVGTHNTGQTPHNKIIIKNCTFNDTSYSSIRLPKVTNSIIENNTFNNNLNGSVQRNCILLRDYFGGTYPTTMTDNVLISNNHFIGSGSINGIFVHGFASADPEITLYTKNVIIENNLFDGSYTSTNGDDVYFIQGGYIKDVKIINNTCNKVKNFFIKSNGSLINELSFFNNKMNYCDDFIKFLANDTQGFSGVTLYKDNNIFTDSRGSINIERFIVNAKITSNQTSSDATQSYMAVNFSETDSSFFTINATTSPYTIAVPKFIHNYKISGKILIAGNASNATNKLFRTWVSSLDGAAVIDVTRSYVPNTAINSCNLTPMIFKGNNLKSAEQKIGVQAYLISGDQIQESFGPQHGLTYLTIEGIN